MLLLINLVIWLALAIGLGLAVWFLSGSLLVAAVVALIPVGLYLWRAATGIRGGILGFMSEWNREATGIPLFAVVDYSQSSKFDNSVKSAVLYWGIAASWASSAIFGALPERSFSPTAIQKSFGPHGRFLKASTAQSRAVFAVLFCYYAARRRAQDAGYKEQWTNVVGMATALPELDLWPLSRIITAVGYAEPQDGSHWALGITPIVFSLVRTGELPESRGMESLLSAVLARDISTVISIPEVAQLLPDLVLPSANDVLNTSSSAWSTVKEMHAMYRESGLRKESEALTCGIALVTFLDDVLGYVEKTYTGATPDSVLSYLKIAGAVQNSPSRRPISAAQSNSFGLRGLEFDMQAGASFLFAEADDAAIPAI